MDVDMDIDQELMQKFSCMGTTDKDVLISEFQKLLGFQLNPAGCAFFLDMANWQVWGHVVVRFVLFLVFVFSVKVIRIAILFVGTMLCVHLVCDWKCK